MGLSSESTSGYMPQGTDSAFASVMDNTKDKSTSGKKKIHLFKKIKKRFGLARRSSAACEGPNNLPPLQFHSVHGDNIRISRDGTMARRFESFCRAITFSARPVRINERICVKFTEISNNWNGGIRFGFTNIDPATLVNALPKYACPDLTNKPGFWAKALHEQYCEKDNILYYYVNTAGDIIYGINNEEKGVILSGIDTRGLLWTIIDVYGNCTVIEFLDARISMYQQSHGVGRGTSDMVGVNGLNGLNGGHHLTAGYQQTRRSLPVVSLTEQELERNILQSMQSLNISADQANYGNESNSLAQLVYNGNGGRLIPVPFHLTKGRNIRLTSDRFIASRVEFEFCQGYVFTARPIQIGEKIIVQILKTDKMYDGSLALGLTSCNPAILQPGDLPNDSDFLLDRPEYWVVSKVMGSAPQRGDEIAFFVTPNGEVNITKNNGPSVVIMHVDQSLQLWAFLDVYGSTQSVRMFRQPPLTATVANTHPQMPPQMAAATSSSRIYNIPIADSLSSLNSNHSQNQQTSSKLMHTMSHGGSTTLNTASTSTLTSLQSANAAAASTSISAATAMPTTTNAAAALNTISVPTTSDMIQIQPNIGGTVLVVNLPPPAASSVHDLSAHAALAASQLRNNSTANNKSSASVISSAITAINSSSNTAVGLLAGTSTSAQAASTALLESNSCVGSQNVMQKNVIDYQKIAENSGSAECTICYENHIDSVLYMCGHMCMCYDCAIEQWRGVGGGQCPLCRAVIRDVIRTYTT